MPNIATMIYDADYPADLALVPSVTLVFNASGTQTQSAEIHEASPTCTYLGNRDGGPDNRPTAAHVNEDGGGSLESRLIGKLLVLLQNPPPTGEPLWWHMWKTLAEDRWLHSQQVSVARRLVRHQELVEEMCQVSTIHLGPLLQRSPSLGLSSVEFPLHFARRARRTIRSGLITWLRSMSGERRRMAPWSPTNWGRVHNLQLIDNLEIAAAMRDLPALHRDVVEMRSVGYKRSEIARVLNLSIFQVDRIFASCRDRLRRRLRAMRLD